MNVENVEKAMVTFADRLIDLQAIEIRQDAEIRALKALVVELIARSSGQPPELIADQLQARCQEEHQRWLEDQEDENPGLAAMLDRRRSDQILSP